MALSRGEKWAVAIAVIAVAILAMVSTDARAGDRVLRFKMAEGSPPFAGLELYCAGVRMGGNLTFHQASGEYRFDVTQAAGDGRPIAPEGLRPPYSCELRVFAEDGSHTVAEWMPDESRADLIYPGPMRQLGSRACRMGGDDGVVGLDDIGIALDAHKGLEVCGEEQSP